MTSTRLRTGRPSRSSSARTTPRWSRRCFSRGRTRWTRATRKSTGSASGSGRRCLGSPRRLNAGQSPASGRSPRGPPPQSRAGGARRAPKARSHQGEPREDLVVRLLRLDLRALEEVPEGGTEQRLVVQGPARAAPVLEDDRPLTGIRPLLVLERPSIPCGQAGIADDHGLQADLLEPERQELGEEVLPDPFSEGHGLLVRDRFHHLHEEGPGEGDHPELLREDVPLHQSADRRVHQEGDADPLAVGEPAEEVVHIPLDANRTRNAAAGWQCPTLRRERLLCPQPTAYLILFSSRRSRRTT